jgi:flavin reductase (DIM6/NTAB) family NADH-FMN oxidoreductase RutF
MFDIQALRVGMRQWATGVTVVSASFEGMRHGMTVNAFTSISLEPPLLLVSLSNLTRTHALVTASQNFGVTILNQNQRELSERFAGRIAQNQDRFEGVETFTLQSDSPLLLDGLACFDCQVQESLPIGDHTLFIGLVVALRAALEVAPNEILPPEHAPLIYYNRSYHSLK